MGSTFQGLDQGNYDLKKLLDLQNPPITNGRKYQVLFMKSWKTWSRAVARKRTTNIAAAASDGV